ncbi:MAG: uracil-DNA glycosylase [Sulfurospirillum sp.]|nr:MAG: uracil-DNA glycosylase [Sulfurospirillum sp.]
MENLQKLKHLQELYKLRAFGFDYYSKPKEPQVESKFDMQLPSNFTKLKDIVLNCSLCSLSKSRKNIVFGEGNENATVMFVGEGPGSVEDETGRPFVGRSGQLLSKIIETTLELKREDVYIANIVKCRPPLNRVPTKDEAQTCLPYLLKQIELIDPKIIITLGATAYQYLSGDYDSSISKIRGEIVEFKNAMLMPTFHPSFLLRNPSAKRYVFNDMKKVKALL